MDTNRLKRLGVEGKLGLGAGLLLALVLLLSLLGLYGQNSHAESLRMVNRIGSLFDEIMFAREANFNYALTGDPRHLRQHDRAQRDLLSYLDGLDETLLSSPRPAQYRAITQKLRGELEAYLEARSGASGAELLAANERLATLLDDANALYRAEEGYASEQNRRIRYLLAGIALIALCVGALTVFHAGRRVDDQAMEESQSRLRAILDTAVDGIITIDSRGSIQSVNRSVERLFGWSAAELVGRNVNVLMPEPDHSRHDGYIASYLRSGVPKIIGTGREVTGRRKDGSLMPMRLAVGRVDMPGEPLFVGFITDITERHTLETSLREAAERAKQAAEAKGAFLANMSHEIRTPMNAIIGFTELLLRRGELSDTQRGHLNTVRQSARALLGLLNDILDTTRLEKGGLTLESIDFSLKDLALQIAASLRLGAEAKGLRLDLHYPQQMDEYFRGDPLRVQQVLTNLLGNAVKFTQQGSVSLVFAQKEDGVQVQVRDTGIGMTPEQVAAIFAPFTQADASIGRRFGGTGLGTTIARQLLELMGGSIEIESEAGRGSVFHVHLPLPAGRKQSATLNEDGTCALPRLNVLVADDVPQNLELVQLLLEQHGHRVIGARDGEDAVHKYMDEHFDVVLMDVHMPGTDGLQASRRIRRHEQDAGRTPTPIIALTASVMAADRRAAHAAGMTGFAVKPLDEARLMAEIAQVLNIDPAPAPVAAAEPERPPGTLIDWPAGGARWGSEARLARAMGGFLAELDMRHLEPVGEGAARDWQATIASLHGIRGAAGNLALPAIAELAGALENRLRRGEREGVEAQLERLCGLLAAARAQLHAAGAAPVERAADDAEQLARMSELRVCLARNELDGALLESVCADLALRGERELGDALRQAVETFEFEQAHALLQRLLAARSAGAAR